MKCHLVTLIVLIQSPQRIILQIQASLVLIARKIFFDGGLMVLGEKRANVKTVVLVIPNSYIIYLVVNTVSYQKVNVTILWHVQAIFVRLL